MADTFSDAPVTETPSRPQDHAALIAEGRKGRSTGKSLIGKPVISLDTGAQIGETHDVVYSATEGRLIGFTLLQNAGLFKRGDTYWLAAESLHALGEDAVTVQNDSSLVAVDGDVNDYAAAAGQGVLGKRLMTEEGKFLGAIDDVLVERTSMKVVAYEVSGGILQDLYQGQTDVPVQTVTSIGQDVVIVPSSVQALIETPKGGLVAVAAAAQVKASELTQEAATGIATARTQAAEAIEKKEADYALGKQAGRDVTTEDGTPVVTTGQTITPAIIEQAIKTGQMHALAASAGYDQAGDAVAATKEKAGDLTDAAKVKLGQAGEAIEDKHGDLLVGKTTGRAVVSEAGLPLVPANHVITEADVLAVRSANRLDDLTLAVGAAVVNAGKENAAAAYDATRAGAVNAYDATKTGAANAYDAATDQIAAAQSAAPVAPVAVPVAPAAPAVAPVTIIVEQGGNVTVDTTGAAVHSSSPAADSDLQKS